MATWQALTCWFRLIADAVQGLIGLPVYGGHGRGGRLLGDGFIEGGTADVFALAEVAFFGLDFMVFACGQANGDNFGGDFTGFTAAGSGHGLLRFVSSFPGVSRGNALWQALFACSTGGVIGVSYTQTWLALYLRPM
jgi:hypothetical protein